MKKSNKWLALGLSAVMLMLLFTGCGKVSDVICCEL